MLIVESEVTELAGVKAGRKESAAVLFAAHRATYPLPRCGTRLTLRMGSGLGIIVGCSRNIPIMAKSCFLVRRTALLKQHVAQNRSPKRSASALKRRSSFKLKHAQLYSKLTIGHIMAYFADRNMQSTSERIRGIYQGIYPSSF